MHDFKEQYGVYYGERLISFTVIRRKRKTLEIEKINQRAENFSKSEKNTNKLKEIKKKIAWIETLISEKLYQENEVKNG